MKLIEIKDLAINPVDLIANKWLLITAGKPDSYNTMTASWGQMGSIWGHGSNGKPTFTVFIRPSRYTDQFVDNNECFSICFFDDLYKRDLAYLGSHSGKDEDKISKTGLHVKFLDDVPCFKEASLIFICKKIYKGRIKKGGFIEKEIIENFYEDESFHNVYVGEIIKTYVE